MDKWDDCETPWIDKLFEEKDILEQKLDIALSTFARIVGPSISASTPKEGLKIYDIIWEAQDKIRKVGEDA